MNLGAEEQRLMADVEYAARMAEEAGPVSRISVVDSILAYLVGVHGREKVTEMIRTRLAAGQGTYGELADTIRGGRNFLEEFDEECIDAIVYDWAEYRREEILP